MALSRPVLLALVGALLAAATLFAARGARETAADTEASPASTQSATPVTPAAPVTPAPLEKPRALARESARGERTGGEGPKADTPGEDTPKADAPTSDRPGKPADRGDRRDLPARESGPTARLKIPAGVPRPVGRALARKRVVVLFFGQQGADDRATFEAVASVRGQKGVSVFRDDITDLAKYRAVTGGLGVAQAPATVVIGSDRQAQLLEGFLDEGTLRQIVLDAR